MKITIPLPCIPLSHQQNTINYPKTAICPSCNYNFKGRELKNNIFLHQGKSEKLAQYQVAISAEIDKAMKKLGARMLHGPYAAKFRIYVPRNVQRPDIMNLIKPIEDACNAILYADDKNCEDLQVQIRYGYSPNLEIIINPIVYAKL